MTHPEALTHSQHAHATHRVDIIRAYEASGLSVQAFCAQAEDAPSHQTLYRWVSSYARGGYNALVPQYGKTRGRSSIDEITLDAILQLYLTQNKLALRYCVAIVENQLQRDISYDAVRRAVHNLPQAVVDKYRSGAKYFNDRHVAHIKRNYEHLKVMQWVCMDHHLIDVFVRDEKTGKAKRVWLTCAQDMRSRYIVAWRIVEQPNEIIIAECLYEITTRHGVAEQYYIDNGKDFTSTLLAGSEKKRYKNKLTTLCYADEKRRTELAGIYASLGSRVVFATPYHPESKPIERFFKEVNQQFSRLFPSYAGSNTADRPDRVSELWKKSKHNIAQLPTIDEMRRTFGTWLAWWHGTHEHRGHGMAGRPPRRVFETEARITRVDIPSEQLPIIFSRVEKRHVYQGVVTWDGVQYYADALVRYSGMSVECLRPIFELGVLYIRDLRGRIVCIARANVLLTRGGEDDLARLRKAKKGQRAQLEPYEAGSTYGTPPQLLPQGAQNGLKTEKQTPPTRRKRTRKFTLLEG